MPWREGAGAYPIRDLAFPRWFGLHHTGEGPARPTVDEVARFQVGPTAQAPFPTLAYTIFVEVDGQLILANDLHAVCWSNGDGSPYELQGVGIYNWWTVSCCFSGENPTEAQVKSMILAYRAVNTILRRSLEPRGHRQISGSSDTECPGPEMDQWLPLITAGPIGS